ncbi:GtrA family protein [Sedimentitalea nanhaiensis]|uniref:GtrA-like protein n=1 Tax=Sedimentitalea nanhaiensis TaxID=999627 RepID=A0A1I7DLV1_9RHOB|nr:GtrA family protein [Sedimentitalea nanhaiensis]SFU12662.1 GtrA-like protein [Sedimentitalea nanhaiensis]
MQIDSASLRDLLWTGTKFGLVGLTTVGLYFIVLALARPFIANVVILSLFAYVASAAFNFVAQARVTFGSTPTGTRLVRYILMHLLCMGMNATLIYTLIERMDMGFYPAQILVTVIIAGTSFVLSRLWVYR